MKYRTSKIHMLTFSLLVGMFLSVGLFATTVEAQTTYRKSEISRQTDALAGPRGAEFGNARDPRQIAALLINSLLGLLGTAFVVYLIYGGFLIMTAAGGEERLKKGQHIIRNAVIGLIIILFAYIITAFTIRMLYESSLPEGVSCKNFQGGNYENPDDPLGQGIDVQQMKDICDIF